MTSLAKKIEALLFITGEELSRKNLHKNLNANEEDINSALTELESALKDHALALILTDTHVKLTTGPDISEFISEITRNEKKQLSKAAAETLALIAYRGPIATHDVSIIRGVDSKRIVSHLLRRGLIKKASSNTDTAIYEITIEFLQHLGLTRKEDLPEFDKLSNNESIRRVIAETL